MQTINLKSVAFYIGLSSLLFSVAAAADVGAEQAQQIWKGSGKAVFDAAHMASVSNLSLSRDAAGITLSQGRLGLAQPLAGAAGGRYGEILAAAFQGTGRLKIAPSLAEEKQQLTLFTGQPVLDAEFDEAVFVFSDSTADGLLEQLHFSSGDPAPLQKIYDQRHQQWVDIGVPWEPRLVKALVSDHSKGENIFVAEVHSKEFDWLTFIYDESSPEQLELVHFDRGRRAWDIWTKFPAEGKTPAQVYQDPLADLDYHINHYQMDVTVNKDTELKAKVAVDVEVKRAGERGLLFSLDPHLRVSRILEGKDRELPFFQAADPGDNFYLAHYLLVVAPQPFSEGPHTLTFEYGGKKIVTKVGNGNYFCQSFGWYPSYELGRPSSDNPEFASRAAFDLTLRVPKKFQAVAVGVKGEDKKEGDFRVTRWKSEKRLPVAGFAFGDYMVKTRKEGNTEIQVYANRQPDDTFRGLELLAQEHPGALALGSLSPSRMAKTMAIEVANSLKLMELFFGPYPYRKLAVTDIPYAYGQGWPSLLYISSLSFLDSTQRHQLGIRDQVQLTDFFRAHETSHQWWGHKVGWKSYHDQWLSEGFAEFSGYLYTLFRKNDFDQYTRLLRNSRQRLMMSDRNGVQYDRIGPIYEGIRLSSAKHRGGYSNIVYKKGGWVLHMLRMLLLDPSNKKGQDTRFIEMMRDFTSTYANQSASTEDFKAIVEKHMIPAMDLDQNGKMDWFFNDWVYQTGIPHLRFTSSVEPSGEPGKFLLKGSIEESNVPQDFRTLIPIYFHKGDAVMRAGWIDIRKPETNFQTLISFQPDKVTLNDWEDVLADVEQ